MIYQKEFSDFALILTKTAKAYAFYNIAELRTKPRFECQVAIMFPLFLHYRWIWIHRGHFRGAKIQFQMGDPERRVPSVGSLLPRPLGESTVFHLIGVGLKCGTKSQLCL